MVAMVQRLDASGFFFHTLLSVSALLALVLKVFRNRFGCHGESVAELCPFNLSNFVHSLTIHRLPRRDGVFEGACQPVLRRQVGSLQQSGAVRPRNQSVPCSTAIENLPSPTQKTMAQASRLQLPCPESPALGLSPAWVPRAPSPEMAELANSELGTSSAILFSSAITPLLSFPQS